MIQAPRRIPSLLVRPLLLPLLMATLSMGPLGAAVADARDSGLYEIPYKGPAMLERLEKAGIEVLAMQPGAKLHVAADDAALATIEGLGLTPRLLAAPGTGKAFKELDVNLGQYRTYSEMLTDVAALEASYPSLVEVTSIGLSVENREITMLKISDNVGSDESEPEVLVTGCHHARELMSSEVPIKLAEYLLAEYGSNPLVTQLVDEREIFIVPFVNPDGHVYVELNHAGDWWDWWRKNRRDNGDGSIGIDPNRNYGYEWGRDDRGSSGNPSSWLYRGPAPFSEPETQAIRDLCDSREFVLAFNYHNYGELILYPWAYEYGYSPDHPLFAALGDEFASSNGYFPGNPAMGAIYLVNGDSDDWMYADVTAHDPILAFTLEINTAAQGGFGPEEIYIQPTFDLLLPMNLRMIELADGPEVVLPPTSPVMAQPAATTAGELLLQWSPNLPADPNPAASYEVERFTNPDFLAADDAEAGLPFWQLQGGFVTSTARQNSGTTSYFGGRADGLSSTLVTDAPYAVTGATSAFGFWTWYDIETHWDYAYVEVSGDQGLTWAPIAGNITTNSDPNGSNRGHGITGSSGGWVEAQFPLDDFLGQTILLRIHYNTDGSVLGEGIYVDDVGPVPSYDSRTIVASDVPDVQTADTPSVPDRYAYRVRGVDAEGDESDWSNRVTVDLLSPVDARPVLPTLSRIGPNHPNPFNPSTLIPFTVGVAGGSRPSRIELAVFDVSGRRVATLVDRALPPGDHRARWNGRSDTGGVVSSGTYFARLSVNGQPTDARKLILLK